MAEQKRICAEIQMQFWQDATYLPLGCYYQKTAYRQRMSKPRMGFPQFYDVRLDG